MAEPAMRVLQMLSASVSSPFMMDLVDALKMEGVEPLVASVAPAGELQDDLRARGVEVLSLNAATPRAYPSTAWQLARRLRAARIQVVHTHTTHASVVGLAAARIAGTVALMTRHHSDERLLYPGWKGRLADVVLGRWLSESVVAPGARTVRALREIDGVPASKIRMIPYGFAWRRIQPTPGGPARVRAELGLEGKLVLCTVGRLTTAKGQDVLLRACDQLGLPPDVRILIVGTGADESRFRELADSLGLAERCVFAGYRRDVFDVMAAADLLVHPSLGEAQCQVLIEAFALGLPVIATAVGSAEDVIIPGETGWLVPPNDVAALAAAMREALAARDRWPAFGAAGRDRVVDAYAVEKTAASYVELYRRLLSLRNRRHNPPVRT